jgi:glycosyltransferase involved in cell wall biosynthesis
MVKAPADESQPPMNDIAFSWNGLPQYAARLLAAVRQERGQPFPVIGSRPAVPVGGIEEALGWPAYWVEAAQPVSWKELGLPVPKVFFQSGWAYPAFNTLGDEVRVAGGKVCLLMDNNWRGDLRQLVGAPWFRACQRRKFSAVLVPGKSGRRLARWYGMPDEKIFEGMYGADPRLFFNGPPLSERPRRIIFVGQYIERKGCVPLARAFASVAHLLPGWELCMYGSGPLHSAIPAHPQIKVHGFVQPEQLGALYREARIFALPSHAEAWGLVVHEAALSGCQLLLSEAIGSAPDFASSHNSRLFKPGDESVMASAMLELAQFEALGVSQAASVAAASSHGPAIFAKRVSQIISYLS